MMNDLEPYENESELVKDVLELARSQQDLIEKLIADLDEANARLKEHDAVVRCKDCRMHYNELRCPCGGYSPDDWFCSAGKRKEGQ